MKTPLLICMRVHKNFNAVVDLIESVLTYTSGDLTKVMVAVDGGRGNLGHDLEQVFPGHVYESKKIHAWGISLLGFLFESITWAKAHFEFEHFLSIDFDTAFVGTGVDEYLLSHIKEGTGMAGGLGCTVSWIRQYKKDKERLEKVLGPKPASYTPGEGVQGGCMLLTAKFLEGMQKSGYLDRDWTSVTSLTDDHVLPLLCRYLGLGIEQVGPRALLSWKLRSAVTDLANRDIIVFHPMPKSSPSGELLCRNHFRKLRGAEPLRSLDHG